MDPLSASTEGPSSGIFLSHAHEDKPFVRRLARDLQDAGIKVWVDEAEMGVGESLIAKIEASISEMDYVGAVISPHSKDSQWVKREIKLAMRGDVPGKRV